MGAAPPWIEKWAFQVQAQHARHTFLPCSPHGVKGRSYDILFVADQRWQKSGRPTPCMGRCDDPQRIYRGRIIEQYAAATVRLQIDKTRHETPALQIDLGQPSGCRTTLNEYFSN